LPTPSVNRKQIVKISLHIVYISLAHIGDVGNS
jgi:hypothetical protein